MLESPLTIKQITAKMRLEFGQEKTLDKDVHLFLIQLAQLNVISINVNDNYF